MWILTRFSTPALHSNVKRCKFLFSYVWSFEVQAMACGYYYGYCSREISIQKFQYGNYQKVTFQAQYCTRQHVRTPFFFTIFQVHSSHCFILLTTQITKQHRPVVSGGRRGTGHEAAYLINTQTCCPTSIFCNVVTKLGFCSSNLLISFWQLSRPSNYDHILKLFIIKCQ